MTSIADPSRPAMIRFQRDAELDLWRAIAAEELVAGAPVQRGLTLVDEPAHGYSAGLWDCTAQTSAWMDQPSHEFMLLLEGDVTIVEASRETTFRAGEAFVLPQGLRCQWKQPGYVKKFWVTFEDPALSAPGTASIRVDPQAILGSSAGSPAAILDDGSPIPQQGVLEAFVDPSGRFSVGVWDTTAYSRRIAPFERWELMHIVDGSTVLTDELGRAETVVAGDTFLVPLGARLAWRGDEYLRKIYCSFTPAEPGTR